MKKKISDKTLIKRCYAALMYARDYIDTAMGEGAVNEFDEDVGQILKGRKTDGQKGVEAILWHIKNNKKEST